jgi:hypothetical protein
MEMKKLKQYMFKGIVGLQILPQLIGCAIRDYPGTPTEGIVISENYTPGSGGWNSRDSTYNIRVKTSNGIYAINVKDSETISGTQTKKESLDSLIDEGTKVEFYLFKDELDKQIINRYPEGIRIK